MAALGFAYDAGLVLQISLLFSVMTIFQTRRWFFICASMILSLWITLAIAAFFPAIPPTISAGEVQNIGLVERSSAWGAHIVDVYNHTYTQIPYTYILSIIEFPAFHVTLAVLLMYASLSFNWLVRCVFIPLDIAIIFATPVAGVHFFSSCVAGGLVAIVGIGATHLIMKGARRWCLRCYNTEELPLNAICIAPRPKKPDGTL